MRFTTHRLLLAACLVVSATADVIGTGDKALPASLDIACSESSLAVTTGLGIDSAANDVVSNATAVTSSPSLQPAHATTQTTATPDSKPLANATSSKPADAAGGAILPQMQGSMAGLLGFCIMSLIML